MEKTNVKGAGWMARHDPQELARAQYLYAHGTMQGYREDDERDDWIDEGY